VKFVVVTGNNSKGE